MPGGKRNPGTGGGSGPGDPPEVEMPSYVPVEETALAAQTDFTIPWDYLRNSHLVVTVDAVAQVLATDFTLVNNGTILRFNSALAGGEAVVISRSTPIDARLVDFSSGSSLSEDELNEAFNQLFFALEEYNYVTQVADLTAYVATASTAATAAETAETAAEAAQTAAELAETNAEAALATFATAYQGMISGLKLSRSSATVVAVAPGVAADSAGAVLMELTASDNIDITLTGVAGGISSRATSTWYHVFLIKKNSDGSIEAYADTSVTCLNIPTGFTEYRRIGSFYLNATGAGEVRPFVQDLDEFLWTDPELDYSNDAPGTSAVTVTTLAVPPDVKSKALLNVRVDPDGGTTVGPIYISSPDQTDLAPDTIDDAPNAPLATFGGFANIATQDWFFNTAVRTGTTKNIRFRLGTDMDVHISTLGWIDSRGRV